MKNPIIRIPGKPGSKLAALISITAVITTLFWTYTEATNHYIRIAATQTYTETTKKLTVQERITKALNGEYNELMLKLAQCESYTNEYFHGVNTDRSVDRGVFAINDKQMPNVSDECAFNVECAAKYTLKRIKEGDSHLWLCMRRI